MSILLRYFRILASRVVNLQTNICFHESFCKKDDELIEVPELYTTVTDA